MNKKTVNTIFAAILLSLGLCCDSVMAGGTNATVEAREPLDNRALHQLRRAVAQAQENMLGTIRGREVKIRVVISTLQYEGGFGDQDPRPYQKIVCKVLKPEEGSWASCDARLISLKTGFFRTLEAGGAYLLEGIIADDDYDAGHFWIYAHRLTKMKPAGAAEASSVPESKTKSAESVEALLARVRADAPNITNPMPVRQPLGNRDMHLLRMEMDRLLDEDSDRSVTFKGTRVKLRVVISSIRYRGGFISPHYRLPCQQVICEVVKPDDDGWRRCRAKLINLRTDFYSSLKEGEVYLLEGIIADDHYGFGHFWIYPNKLTKSE
jgi:hypothetical protein